MGRTAKFDREQVIENAMNVFWARGYHAASMSDLKEAMDLQPGSIYGAFGSKDELFLLCLESYSAAARARFAAFSESSETEREAFEKIFNAMIDQMEGDKECRGCLMINTLVELSSHDHSAGVAARGYLKKNQDFFAKLLKKAKASGELSSSRTVAELAAFVMGGVFSLRVMGKAGVGRKVLESIRDQTLDQVFG